MMLCDLLIYGLCSPVRLSLPCSCLQHHSGWLIKAALIDRALKPLYSALFCSFLCGNPCISQSRLQVNTTVSRTSKLRKLRLNGFFSPRGQAETQNCTTTPGLMCFTSPLFFSLYFREWSERVAGGWMLLSPGLQLPACIFSSRLTVCVCVTQRSACFSLYRGLILP